jgi:hypothetical protein
MAIPKWMQEDIQKRVNSGALDYNLLNENVKKQIKPREIKPPDLSNYKGSNIGALREIESKEAVIPKLPAPTQTIRAAKETLPQKVKRIGGSLLIGAGEATGIPALGEWIFRQSVENEVKKGMMRPEVAAEQLRPVSDAEAMPMLGLKGTKGEAAARTVGELGGALLPIVGIQGGVARALPKVPRLAQIGITGGMYEGGKSALQGEPLPEVAKSAAEGAVLWPAMDVGLGLAAKGVKAGVGKLMPKRAPIEPPPLPETKPAYVYDQFGRKTELPRANTAELEGKSILPKLEAPADRYLPTAQQEAAIQFNKTLEGLRPTIEPLAAKPVIKTEADQVNLIFNFFEGKVSKGEIRRMPRADKEELTSEILANWQKPNLWNIAKEEASKRGVNLDELQRMAVSPEYAERGAVAGALRTPRPRAAEDFKAAGLELPKVKAKAPRVELPKAEPPKSTLPKGVGAMELQLPDTAGQIVSKSQKQPVGIRKSIEKVYNKFSDNLARIEHFGKAVEKATGTKLSPQENAYLLAKGTRKTDETAKMILEQDLRDAQDNVIGESLASVLGKISGKQYAKVGDVAGSKVTSDLSAFEDYLLHRHAPSWYKRGKTVFPEDWMYTPEMSEKKIAEYERLYPEFKAAAKAWDKWWGDFGKAWLVDTGLMTERQWIGWRKNHPHYIKLQRQMADVEKSKWTVGRAAKGSERPIISPIESAIEDVFGIVRLARTNQAKRAIADNIAKSPDELAAWGKIVKENPTEEELLAVQTQDVEKLLESETGAMEFFEKARIDPKHGNQMVVKINGKPVIVRIQDVELLEAVSNLTPKAQAAVLAASRQVTRVFKTLTTGANPVFSLGRNILRDLPASYVFGNTANPITWARDIVGALVDIIGNREMYKSFKAMGGTMYSSAITSDRSLLAESKARLLPDFLDVRKPAQAVGRGLKSGYQGLEKVLSVTESLPRLGEYRRTVRRGGGTFESKLQGIANAAEVTVDFSKHGSWSKEIDSFTPYFNAAIQGLDRVYRAFKYNPVQTAGKALMAVTVPTIALYLHNRNDPNYQRLSSWVKDNYFCIPKGDGTFIKIAKPRELGVLFSSLPERILRAWADQDPRAFEGFAETFWTTFAPPNPFTENIISPAANIAMNPEPRDFAGRPIVPGYMKNLSPGLQYDEKTSSAAKKLGEMFPEKVSPKKVDSLARSYLGVVAQLGIPALSEGSTLDMVERMFVADPAYSQDAVNTFYEAKTKVDTMYYDEKAKGGALEGENEKLRKLYGKIADTISETNKQMREIQRANPKPDEATKQQLRGMQLAIVAMAEIAEKPMAEQMQLYETLKKKGRIEEAKPKTVFQKAKETRNAQKKYDEMKGLLLP